MSTETFTAVLIDARGHILHKVFGKTRYELQGIFGSWAFTIANGDRVEVAVDIPLQSERPSGQEAQDFAKKLANLLDSECGLYRLHELRDEARKLCGMED